MRDLEKRRESQRRYDASAKGRARNDRYEESERGKTTRKRYSADGKRTANVRRIWIRGHRGVARTADQAREIEKRLRREVAEIFAQRRAEFGVIQKERAKQERSQIAAEARRMLREETQRG